MRDGDGRQGKHTDALSPVILGGAFLGDDLAAVYAFVGVVTVGLHLVRAVVRVPQRALIQLAFADPLAGEAAFSLVPAGQGRGVAASALVMRLAGMPAASALHTSLWEGPGRGRGGR